MAKDQEKLLVLGMGSSSDKKAFDNINLYGKTIDDYFKEKGIKIYHYPGDNSYLTTSIHRTTANAIKYAHDMKRLGEQGHKVVSLLYGGLAFAMPGVVAAEAPNIPVIAVGSDEDAFYNTYKIPDGTPVGVVEVGNLTKGLKLAEKVLNVEAGDSVNFISQEFFENYDDVKDMLGKFCNFNEIKEEKGIYKGLTVRFGGNPNTFSYVDKRVELGIVGFEKSRESKYVINDIKELENSIVVGRPKNVALYVARIIGLSNPDVRKKLIAFREEEAEKYPKRIPMSLEHFK